ncbi:unnamed protein product [Acanthoscelides obtectus]|uniref:Uncharacterized protein n=1 Tax=Acanthoscelides obtectus TaxID=200917 RepID=A0A9P0KPL5_ACAOB|nr:unnamed protein product [Acanthoscelides obtectus]CAK1685800.1 hypothetical protein AOBTE_LOCUS35625 [Acanthoscelides obtectus]
MKDMLDTDLVIPTQRIMTLKLSWNGVHFLRRLPLHKTSPSTSKVLPKATYETLTFCGQVLYKRILQQRKNRVRRRGWLRPQKPPLVRDLRLKNLGCGMPLAVTVDLVVHRCGGLEDDVRHRVNTVAVFLPLPQFAANKTDCNHAIPDFLPPNETTVRQIWRKICQVDNTAWCVVLNSDNGTKVDTRCKHIADVIDGVQQAPCEIFSTGFSDIGEEKHVEF